MNPNYLDFEQPIADLEVKINELRLVGADNKLNITDEIQKLHVLAGKAMSLKAIAKALTRSEESVKDRAKLDGLKIAKLR